jgi:hypothetical protein
MSETALTDNEANALSGTSDTDTDQTYPTIGSAYSADDLRWKEKVNRQLKTLEALRVFKDGDLTFGVRPGRYLNGDTAVNYAGATDQALTDDATNYIYLTAAGTLTVNTTGFPATSHLPLATIVAADGEYDHDDMTDYRGRCLLAPTLVQRSRMVEEALADCPIDILGNCRNEDGSPLDETGSDDNFRLDLGTYTAGCIQLYGADAQGNTKTNTLMFELALPPEYVAGGDLKLIAHAKYDGPGVKGQADIDMTAFKRELNGTGGSDLVTTSPIAMTDSFADREFTVNASGLAAGDHLICYVRTEINESGGSDVLVSTIGQIRAQMDIQG